MKGGKHRRIFVSSPGDVDQERRRVDRVIERLNTEFTGTVEFEAVRWETRFYKADAGFQAQIARSTECDIVIGIFWSRLGSPLPIDFEPTGDGNQWPSGTAYELMTAIAARRKGRPLPDVYVFKKTAGVLIPDGRPQEEAEILDQRRRLQSFWQSNFHTLEGEFKAAFQVFETPDEFEGKVEALLRRWIAEHESEMPGVSWPVAVKGSPFCGLAPFDAKHASVFYGRGTEIARGVEQLQQLAEKHMPVLFVIGASGSGKSSLVRAGLVPRLLSPGVVAGVDDFRVAVMRPGLGDGAIGNLSQTLFAQDVLPELGQGSFRSSKELATLFAHGDETAAASVVAALEAVAENLATVEGFDRPPRIDLLLVVDQLEELFSEPREACENFARLLQALARSGRVWIVCTLRADLYDQFLAVPTLAAMKQMCGSLDITAPGMAEMSEIVRGPAKAAGLRFERQAQNSQQLDERILADASPEMLPLIQFTLQRLFEQRRIDIDGTGWLTHAVYDRLGGIDGAIDTEAEGVIVDLDKEAQAKLPRMLRQLVVFDARADSSGSGALRSRPVLRTTLVGEDEACCRLVQALTRARILQAEQREAGVTFRLAHERILVAWKRAARITAESREFLRRRSDAEEQFQRWQHAGRHADLLIPRGLSLAEAETLLDNGDELSEGLLVYVGTSVARQRTISRRRALAGIATVAALGTAGTLSFQTFRELARYRSARELEASRDDLNGTVLAYSTSPGFLAVDGKEENSVFTEALLEQLDDPALSITQMLMGAVNRTVEDTGGEQRPQFSTNMNGDIYLHSLPVKRQTFCLSIGVNRYHPKFGDLQTAVKDAEALDSAFRSAGHRTRLMKDPTAAEIWDMLHNIKAEFSGHSISLLPKQHTAAATNSLVYGVDAVVTSGIKIERAEPGSTLSPKPIMRPVPDPAVQEYPPHRRGLVRVEQPPANTVVFLFFAGKGFNYKGIDFILPHDANIGSFTNQESPLENCLAVPEIDDFLKGISAVRVMIIDAARDNPFLSDTR